MYINDDMMPRYECCAQAASSNVSDVMNKEEDCSSMGCGSGTAAARWGIKDHPLAMVYAPLQEWRSLYDLDTALSRGTLFAELDLPFLGGGCKMGGGKNG